MLLPVKNPFGSYNLVLWFFQKSQAAFAICFLNFKFYLENAKIISILHLNSLVV
jgi:hypothetical protein